MDGIVQKSEIFRKIPEIAEDHNFGTEYAKNVKLGSQCAVLDTLLYSTNNSISTKSGFRPLWNWALHMVVNGGSNPQGHKTNQGPKYGTTEALNI